MAGLKVAVFVGSVRDGRMADRVLKVVQETMAKRDMDVQLFGENELCSAPVKRVLVSAQHDDNDSADIFVRFLSHPLHPDPLEREEYQILRKPIHFYSLDEEVPDYLMEDNQALLDSDAYIVICPEYNRYDSY